MFGDIIAWFTSNWEAVLGAITGVIAAASAVAALTPTQVDDNIVAKVKKIADWLAINVKNAKAPAVDPNKNSGDEAGA